MTTKTVTLGRLVLREDLAVAEQVDVAGRIITLRGQESPPRLSDAQLRQRREDVLGTVGSVVAATFTTKTYLNGFYRVEDGTSSVEDWESGLRVVPWELTLRRLGTPEDMDLESRLSGAQTRANDFTATGERVHTPPVGETAYYAGTSVTGTINRACADGGTLHVYRGIASGVSPRWVSTPSGYSGGRCRFIDSSGLERSGLVQAASVSGWTLSNGVLRVTPGTTGTFLVEAWDGAQWEGIEWTLQHQNPWVSITSWTELSLSRNDFEMASIRLVQTITGYGRLVVDLTLRRGARFAEIYVQRHAADRIGVVRTAGVVSTQTSGYVAANANDAGGNRSVVASARTFTADLAAGGVTKTATATLDAMVGVVLGGSGAISGDAASDLYAQYLGAPAEHVTGVRR